MQTGLTESRKQGTEVGKALLQACYFNHKHIR